MKCRSIISAIIAVSLLGVAVSMASPLHADPAHPTAMEVNTVVDMLRFRSGMLADPAKTIATYATSAARGQFAAITRQMTGVSGGPAGWRYLLGTSVFTAAGLNERHALIVFYNPWVDTAVFTLWEARKEGHRIVDIDWVPGDLVRQANAAVDPRPLWLRGEVYRPQALIDAVTTTVKAIEARFGDGKKAAGWRDVLGIREARRANSAMAQMLSERLLAAQLRLNALANPGTGEDKRLAPLRTAIVMLVKTIGNEGFAKPLAQAKDTSAPMKQILAKINRQTMRELAPVAYVVGDGHATVFFASTLTADYTLSARFAERISGYELQQLEFIPYAADFQTMAGHTAQ